MTAFGRDRLAGLLPSVKEAALDSLKGSAARKPPHDFDAASLETKNKGPNDFLTRIDLEVSEYLCGALPRLLPGSPVISEETGSETETDGCRWIIDPIDGTNNLVYGLPFYAVSIALVLEKDPVLGVVYLPATGELFSAGRGCGAFVENALIPGGSPRPIHVHDATSLDRAIVMAETDPYFDRTQNPSIDVIKAVYQHCIDCRITGSAAVDTCYIAAGRAHVHFCRNLNSWDYSGGGAILLEAGGIMSQWNGEPMAFRGKHSSLAASNPAIHRSMLDLIGKFL